MIQLQMLNYILRTKNIDLLTQYDEQFFPDYPSEYKFIQGHLKKYKSIPDYETVLEKFNDFTVLEVNESEPYLKSKLYEEYVYNTSVSIINKGAEMYNKDASLATNFIITKLKEIKPPDTDYGTDIIKSAQDRYDILFDKIFNEDTDKKPYSTGLKELDLIIDGLQKGEEFVILFARTNNGKSWIAEKMAISVWDQGGNIGYFSPEMSADSLGYRFDTLFQNFDNKGMNGSKADFDINKYKSYIKKLSQNTHGFHITNPADFNRTPSVSKFRKWIEDKNLSMIVIDGLSYVYDERSGNRAKETDRLTNISEDLMSLSVEMHIPIIGVVQANRTAARDSDGEVNDDTPDLDTIRNSDGISHNASKVIAIRTKNNTLTLTIEKNRSGVIGNKLIYNWDINTGKFTYMPNPKANLPGEENEIIAEENRQQYNDSEEAF